MSNLLKAFACIAVLHLASKLLNFEWADNTSKVLLLPVLILYFRSETQNSNSRLRTLFTAALFFAWAGDTVLIFSDQAEIYFMVGLLFFLLTQLFYSMLFFSKITKATVTPFSLMMAGIPMIGYGVFLLVKLMPHLGNLLLPVVIYASAITLMGIAAALLFKSIATTPYVLLMAGCISFIASDSLLAVNRFIAPLPAGGFWVMLTYILAQGMITAAVVSMLKPRARQL